MAGLTFSNVFKTADDAVSYRRSLEQQRQESDLQRTIQSFDLTSLSLTDSLTSNKPESYADDLVHVLKSVGIPVSVSFLNVSYASWGKKDVITQRFLAENQDKFSLVVIGNDLKVQLRTNGITTQLNESPTASMLIQLFTKDINKLRMLESSFSSQNITEVSYQTFITKYSTNKHKMNLSFILRNSHALQVLVQGRETYIKFLKDVNDSVEMNEKEIWDIFIQEGLDYFLVCCLKGLLVKFFVPINQGTLQSCFNFGVLVDKIFLQQHNDIFEGAGESGVTLKMNKVNRRTIVTNVENNTVSPKNFVNKEVFTLETTTSASDGASNCEDNDNNDSVSEDDSKLIVAVKRAVGENRSVVLIGNENMTPLFANIDGMDSNMRLRVLLSIRDSIDRELIESR